MPTITGTDNFNHGNFTVPGGGPYTEVVGTPVKDTGTVFPGDLASMKCETLTDLNEYVGYEYSPQPGVGWCAFRWRMNVEETIVQDVLIMYTTGFTHDGKLAWEPTTNELVIDSLGGGTPTNGVQRLPVTLDEWHIIEAIYDATGTTHAMYVQIDGRPMGFAIKTGLAATTVRYAYLGQARLGTVTQYFSLMERGTANGSRDFVYQPKRFDYSRFPPG